jgi:predicted nucleotidyltransferase
MNTAATLSPQIREEVLRDPRYPVHKIADQLLPYLQVLVEQFHPEQIILFGSYAYGEPNRDSDVDLLVVKEIDKSQVMDATAIRKAFRPIRHQSANLPFDIMVRAPGDLQNRLNRDAPFHREITLNGLALL